MTFLVLAAALTAPCAEEAREAACIAQAASAFQAADAAREESLDAAAESIDASLTALLAQFFDGASERPALDLRGAAAAVAAPAPSKSLPRAERMEPPYEQTRPVESPEDSDKDGMSDAEEHEVAQGLVPLVEWASNEPCGEHDLLFQLRPLSPDRVRAVFAWVFPEDCGFRGTGIGGHPGDVQELSVIAERAEGGWRVVSFDLPWHRPAQPASWPARLYVSAGKHHFYPDPKTCRWGKFLFFDRCGGGREDLPTLRRENNVGERGAPRVLSLRPYARGRWSAGYGGENAWGASAWGDRFFCGGDPKRGSHRSEWARFKHMLGIAPCGDALDGKWDRDPALR